MSLFQPVLQLGTFDFLRFEEPESVTFGKSQDTYVHQLIGGGRVIDVMGAHEPDIQWSGYFTGAQAEDRARFVESMTKKGNMLILTTSQFVKKVIIKDFTYGFHFVYPIAYSITLEVIQDLTLPVNFAVPGDLSDTILSALLEAEDIATLVADGSVQSAIALALIAAQEAAPFIGASNAVLNAALAAAQNAQAAIGAAINNAQAGLFG
jgi:hypothetical protein